MPAHADNWRQSEWWLGKLHVVQAWRSGEGAGVTIAVLADGVDARQRDLTGSVVSGPDLTGSDRIPGGPHYGVIGTSLASLIAGHGHGHNHADGIYGVANEARILSVRVTLSPGDPLWSSPGLTAHLPDDIAAGIRYAVKHHASVIALPADPGMPGIHGWGGARRAAGGSPAERAAIAYAVRHNVVLVAPAGDNGQAGDAPNYPAAYRGVIAVGAFGKNFVKAPYSSHRRYVTLTAAGRGVVAATPTGYQTMNSTWAASAIAAGVASLVRSQFPNLTAAQVLKAMTKGTFYRHHGGMLAGSGYGTVDAAKAITEAATMSPPHARLASLGALPRRPPVTPSVPSNGSLIARDLLTDGIIAAGALAGLLVPIAWYGSIVRRRDRRLALAAADRAHQGSFAARSRGMLADPLLEFFGPQDAPPASAAAGRTRPGGSAYQPRPALAGRSTLSPAFTPRPMLAAPPATASDPAPAFGGPAWPLRAPAARQAQPAGDSESDAWLTGEPEPGPGGQTQHTLRSMPVAGSPPWEPAPRPTSELPWAAVPGPAAGQASGGGFMPGTRQAPPESVWESQPATRSSAPRSIFDPDLGPGDAEPGSAPGQRTDQGVRPIYIWNPEADQE